MKKVSNHLAITKTGNGESRNETGNQGMERGIKECITERGYRNLLPDIPCFSYRGCQLQKQGTREYHEMSCYLLPLELAVNLTFLFRLLSNHPFMLDFLAISLHRPQPKYLTCIIIAFRLFPGILSLPADSYHHLV